MITLNEERNIGPCLDSLGWADEVIVVDAGSTDRTAGTARERGSIVVDEAWKGYGHARNVALDLASGLARRAHRPKSQVNPQVSPASPPKLAQ